MQIDAITANVLLEQWSLVKQIHQVITIWGEKGSDAMIVKAKDGKPAWVPKHPEFLYRRAGEWKGWSQFLGEEPGSTEEKVSTERDSIENLAWAIAQKHLCATPVEHVIDPPTGIQEVESSVCEAT